MKKLITSGITGSVGAPFTQSALDNIQANFAEIPDAIIKGIIGSYTTNDLIVLYGVVITLSTVTTTNDTATWTAGAIYYNGEVYQVAAGTLTKTSGVFLYSINDSITNETFDDGNSYPWIEVRTITITSGTSGTGIADYNASSVKNLYDIIAGSWIDVPSGSLTSGWNITGSGYFKYKKDLLGNVHVKGFINTPASSSGSPYTLPSGFTPYPATSTPSVQFIAHISSPAIIIGSITGAGVISFVNGDGSAVDNNKSVLFYAVFSSKP